VTWIPHDLLLVWVPNPTGGRSEGLRSHRLASIAHILFLLMPVECQQRLFRPARPFRDAPLKS
jgi:hypothetical protein